MCGGVARDRREDGDLESIFKEQHVMCRQRRNPQRNCQKEKRKHGGRREITEAKERKHETHQCPMCGGKASESTGSEAIHASVYLTLNFWEIRNNVKCVAGEPPSCISLSFHSLWLESVFQGQQWHP